MARGDTLQELVTMVREEAGHTANAAFGQNTLDGVQRRIRRTYRRLHGDWAWPHLRVWRDTAIAAGSYQYAFPLDLDPERIEEVWFQQTGDTTWRPVRYGIGMSEYNAFDSGADERSSPVRRWAYFEGGMLEVWPKPDTAGTLRFVGLTRPVALVKDNDVCDLDGDLIALYVAAEIKARKGDKDAGHTLEQAAALYQRLKANSQRGASFRLNPTRDAAPSGVRVRAPGT